MNGRKVINMLWEVIKDLLKESYVIKEGNFEDFWVMVSYKSIEMITPVLTRKKVEQYENQQLF